MILYKYLCTYVFTSIKSDDFQVCCVISKKEEKNSGFIAATLYKKAYLTAAVSLSLATRYIRIQKATLMTA